MSVNKFRKKPVVIEAVKFDNINYQEIIDFTEGKAVGPLLESETAYIAGQGAPIFSMSIQTKEGVMKAFPGDYIIREPFPTGDRDFYPCKPDIFQKTYESNAPPSPQLNAGEVGGKVLRWIEASEHPDHDDLYHCEVEIDRWSDGSEKTITKDTVRFAGSRWLTEFDNWKVVRWLGETDAPAAHPITCHLDIPVDEMRKIYNLVQTWNDDIKPWMLKGVVQGYLLATGKMPRYRYMTDEELDELIKQHEYQDPGHKVPAGQPTETPAPEEEDSPKCPFCNSSVDPYLSDKCKCGAQIEFKDQTIETQAPGDGQEIRKRAIEFGNKLWRYQNTCGMRKWGSEGEMRTTEEMYDHLYPVSSPKETVPVQHGEVPEEAFDGSQQAPKGVMRWIYAWLNRGIPMASQRKVGEMIAIAMYHRDQEQIKALQQERDQYKERWERSEANITALTDQLGVIQGERDAMRKGIEFYADPGNYTHDDNSNHISTAYEYGKIGRVGKAILKKYPKQ